MYVPGMGDPFVAAAARGLAALDPPSRVLVAVSGGADSVALLHALWCGRTRSDLRAIDLVIGHFDHGLRTNSGDDAELVRCLSNEVGLPFFLRRETVTTPAGSSPEEIARDRRYAALLSMAEESGAGAVVTAHTATDQAETLLWRLIRGAGSRGLGAMRPSRPLGSVRLLRPLLGVTRDETRAYCVRRGVRFNDDPTNEDHRPRARIRAEVLPVLERLQPGAALRIAEASTRLRDDDDLLESLTPPNAGALDTLRALPLPLRRRALARWAEARLGSRVRLGAAHIAALVRLVDDRRGEVALPSDRLTQCVATVAEGVLVLVRRPAITG